MAVIAGLKWPPEVLPPRPIAIAIAARTKIEFDVNATAPKTNDVPRNSTTTGVSIYIKE